MHKLHLLPLFLLLAISVAACTVDEDSGAELAGDSVDLAPEAAAPSGVDTSQASAVPDTSDPVVTHVATIATEAGDIVVDLYGKDAPKTVENFVGLARKGFYDGIGFHRIIPDYVVQAGDPQTKDTTLYDKWGTGGESIYGGGFADELDPNLASARIGYVRGVLAMANRGPNTQSSQFFIILNDNVKGNLPYNYTIFGKVREGYENVQKIENSSPGVELPRQLIHITGITVAEVAPTS